MVILTAERAAAIDGAGARSVGATARAALGR